MMFALCSSEICLQGNLLEDSYQIFGFKIDSINLIVKFTFKINQFEAVTCWQSSNKHQ